MKNISILMADDDHDDHQLTRDAIERNKLANPLNSVYDGEELLTYLRKQGTYSDAETPGLILLDLNMPKLDGREALEQIKKDPALCGIPIIVMTTSQAEEDIYRSYDLGANSFISKPVTFDGLVDVIKSLGEYWFQIVQLPVPERRA
jgi:two-component system, response regulator